VYAIGASCRAKGRGWGSAGNLLNDQQQVCGHFQRPPTTVPAHAEPPHLCAAEHLVCQGARGPGCSGGVPVGCLLHQTPHTCHAANDYFNAASNMLHTAPGLCLANSLPQLPCIHGTAQCLLAITVERYMRDWLQAVLHYLAALCFPTLTHQPGSRYSQTHPPRRTKTGRGSMGASPAKKRQPQSHMHINCRTSCSRT
jgi:hypothetical protein